MGNTQKTGNYVNAIFQDTSNNIGIGGSPSGSYKLEVTGTAKVSGAATLGSTLSVGAITSSADLTLNGNRTIYLSNPTVAAGAIVFYNSTTSLVKSGIASYYNIADQGNLEFLAGGTSTKMVLTSAGNVGIGTTSPGAKLDVTGAVRASTYCEAYDGTRDLYLNAAADFGLGALPAIQVASNHGLQFATNNSLKMYITSGGQVLINRTATGGQSAKMQMNTNGGDGYYLEQLSAGGFCFAAVAISNGGTYYFNYFQAGASEVGRISSNGTTTTYATSSDYRLKEDFKNFNGLDKISAIKVYDFKFKNSENRMDGVIAHELQEVLPYAVTGEKDGERMQGVDYSLIVPTLVKAIQELNERLNKAGL